MRTLYFLLFITLSILPQFSVAQTAKGFYNPDRVAEIRLNFKVDNWAEELDSLRVYGDDLLLGQAKVDGKSYKNVGVRYRGYKSFQSGSKRNALHIKLNFIDRSQNHQGYKTIKLSNALRDPSMVREVLGFEIARKYMHAPEANLVKVYVNDQYYGLFVNIESISDQFLEKHFGSSDNTFFACNHKNDESDNKKGCLKNTFANLEYQDDVSCYFSDFELKSDYGWDDLTQLTEVLSKTPEKVEEIVNVDQVLWMLAFNNVLVNLSSYSGDKSQNYYLYKDDQGHFNTIIWDLNLNFGSYKNIGGGSDLDLAGLQTLDPLLHENNSAKPLISALLSDPTNKMIYLSHVRTILNENFRKGQYLERAKELQKLAKSAFVQDKNKYYEEADFENSLVSTVGKKSKIPGLQELMEKRASFLKKHPALAILPVEVSQVTVESRNDNGNKIEDFKITARVEKFAKKVTLMYKYSGETVFRSAQMMDDGKHNDGKSGDNVFGVTVKPLNDAKDVEYYIVAENKGAITFSPSDYLFNLYKASLTDLNH